MIFNEMITLYKEYYVCIKTSFLKIELKLYICQ